MDNPTDNPDVSDEWQRIWDLFHAALERPIAHRGEFLDAACGDDDELRSRVDKLLGAHESVDDSLFSAVPPVLTDETDIEMPAEPEQGDEIGPYILDEIIGEGGMGLVYRAHQTRPVRREVALKLLQLGMTTREIVARFDAERQALAVMSHSTIAKIFDAGTTESGRPFVVMEYVDGTPVTTYCDAERLSIDARLRLFLEICDGIKHAHQKGIVHRDIKPSNILVTREGDAVVPKIIDFGIAKATEQKLSEETVHTRIGTMIGTPGYMSPEQAGVVPLDVDVRADVYSLGVLLYELLVGVLPFESITTAKGMLELQEAIRDEEPKRPVQRLSSVSQDDLEELSRERKIRPSALRRRLDGDIAWILLKSMDKDRTRRYASVAELSADVSNLLEGLPVKARAPTRRYRAGRFVRRHRVGVTVASAVSLLLVSFAVVMTIQSIRLQRALEETELERNRAEQVSEFMVELFSAANPEVSGGETVTVRGMLDSGAARLESELTTQPELRARLLATVGETYRVLGGEENTGEAIRLLEEGLSDLRALDEPPAERIAAVQITIATVHHDNGDYDNAEQYYLDGIDTLGADNAPDSAALADALANLGVLHTDRGNLAAAAEFGQRALDMQIRVLGERHVEVARTSQRVAHVLHQQGERELAYPMMMDSLQMLREHYGDDHPHIATALNYTAIVQGGAGDHSGAQQSLREAVAIYRKTHGDEHHYLAATLSNLALAYNRTNNHDEAADTLAEALRIGIANYGEDHPTVNSFRINLGTNLQDMGRFIEAEPVLREGLRRDRIDLDPGSPYLIGTLDRYGGLLNSLGRYEDAETLQLEALTLRNEHLGESHSDTGVATLVLAANYLAWGKLDRAEELCRRALEIQRNAEEPDPRRVAGSLWGLARVLQARGAYADAQALYDEAIGLYDEVPGESALSRARVVFSRSELAVEKGDMGNARQGFAAAAAVFRENLYDGHPDNARADIAIARLRCSETAGREGEREIASARHRLAKSLGEDNWQLALLDVAVADCLIHRGAFADAEARLLASRELLTLILGESHPLTRKAEASLGDLYSRWQRPD